MGVGGGAGRRIGTGSGTVAGSKDGAAGRGAGGGGAGAATGECGGGWKAGAGAGAGFMDIPIPCTSSKCRPFRVVDALDLEQRLADADSIPRLEALLGDPLAVHPASVRAVVVDQDVPVRLLHDPGVVRGTTWSSKTRPFSLPRPIRTSFPASGMVSS